jgi:hypothetical protein
MRSRLTAFVVTALAALPALAGGTRCFDFDNYQAGPFPTPAVTILTLNDPDVGKEVESVRYAIRLVTTSTIIPSPFEVSIRTNVVYQGQPVELVLNDPSAFTQVTSNTWEATGVVNVPSNQSATFTSMRLLALTTGRDPFTVDQCFSAVQVDFRPRQGCPADLAGNPPPSCASAIPDGIVDKDDMQYFTDAYSFASIRADLDDGSGFGTTDGIVDFNDLNYFFNHLAGGC